MGKKARRGAQGKKEGEQLKNREVTIDVMVPSCSCCSAKLEQELATAAGVSKAGVRFVVPLRAQLRYDSTVAKINKIVDVLKERGYEVALERVEFRIPFKPVMPPQAWKVKVATLSEKVEGVVSASVNFASSMIVVEYLPNLMSAKDAREAAISWGSPHSDSRRKEVRKDEPSEIHGDGPEPERVRRDHFHALHSLGPGLSRPRDDPGLGGAPAGV